MANVLTWGAGEGADLRESLMEALGVPATAVWFEVRFAAGSPVVVRCEYTATAQTEPMEPDDPPATNYGGLNG